MFDQFLKKHALANDKIKRVVQPLCDVLPFTHVWYYSITTQGDYTCVGLRQDWMEYFYSKKVYRQISEFFRHPKYFNNSNVLYKAPEHDVVIDPQQPCHINTSLVMVEKTKRGLEGFGFASALQNQRVESAILNDLSLLKQFRGYFKRELGGAIEGFEREPLSLKTMLGVSLFETDPSWQDDRDRERKKLFKLLGIPEMPRFTAREKECLKMTLAGRSAGQIALQLGISVRTAEHYIGNAKDKLDCRFKSELFDKGLLLIEMGLL